MDRYLTVLLRGLLVTCIGLNTALSAADEEVAVNGRNVREVSTGDYGATFVNVESRIWHELREDGSLAFEFIEGGRDEWSVYLSDESRGVGLQLDLWTKDIIYSGGPAVKGHNVRKVSTGDYGATFVNVEGRIWHELREDGSLAFEFTEGGRDEWSVYLSDESRDAGLQIDLWTKGIRFSEKGLPASVLARVYEAFADPSAEPTGEAYSSDGSTFVLAKIDEAFASISPEEDDGLRREWADRAYGLRGSQDDYVRVMESDDPEKAYHAIESGPEVAAYRVRKEWADRAYGLRGSQDDYVRVLESDDPEKAYHAIESGSEVAAYRLRREWADRAYGLRGSQDDYVRVMESDEPEEEYHAIEREFGREEGVESGRAAGFDHGGRGAKMPTDIPPLSIDVIVEWVEVYKKEQNKWPRASSGLVEGVPHKMTWAMVNSALSKGLGGLSGGSSLAELLEEHFDVRGPVDFPDLSIAEIREWAQAHREKHDKWPRASSGPVEDARFAITWSMVNSALSKGLGGLPGGSSLAELQERDTF